MTIIRALVVEHQSLRAVFARMEGALPGVRRLAMVRRQAREVEALLALHARVEEDLVLLTLAHVPKHQAWCRAFYRQHQEIDCSLAQALLTKQLKPAKRFLKKALQHSRRHFTYEERKVFPLWEKWIDPNLLERLGRVWRHRQNGAIASRGGR
jgi:hemerythrin-like domain-containing protein